MYQLDYSANLKPTSKTETKVIAWLLLTVTIENRSIDI